MLLVVKNPLGSAGDVETQVRSLGWEDPLEKGMATRSSILAWNPMAGSLVGYSSSLAQSWT